MSSTGINTLTSGTINGLTSLDLTDLTASNLNANNIDGDYFSIGTIEANDIQVDNELELTNDGFITIGKNTPQQITITDTQIGYLDGINSNIQTQINSINTDTAGLQSQINTNIIDISNLETKTQHQTATTDYTFFSKGLKQLNPTRPSGKDVAMVAEDGELNLHSTTDQIIRFHDWGGAGDTSRIKSLLGCQGTQTNRLDFWNELEGDIYLKTGGLGEILLEGNKVEANGVDINDKFNTIDGSIIANAGSINTNATNIATNSSSITTLSNDITNIQTEVNDNTTDITNLNTNVNNINNLFHQYNNLGATFFQLQINNNAINVGTTYLNSNTLYVGIYDLDIGQLLYNAGFTSDWFAGFFAFRHSKVFQITFGVKFKCNNSLVEQFRCGLRIKRVLYPYDEHISTTNYNDMGVHQIATTVWENVRFASETYIIAGSDDLYGAFKLYLRTTYNFTTSSATDSKIDINMNFLQLPQKQYIF